MQGYQLREGHKIGKGSLAGPSRGISSPATWAIDPTDPMELEVHAHGIDDMWNLWQASTDIQHSL